MTKANDKTADATGVGGRVTDPNGDAPEARPTEEAFDHDAEARGDHGYESVPATGVVQNGKPVALPSTEE